MIRKHFLLLFCFIWTFTPSPISLSFSLFNNICLFLIFLIRQHFLWCCLKLIFAVHTRTIVVPVGTDIRYCTVEDNQYSVGHPFSFTEDCFRFNCECYSDGSWECPSERSEYICRLGPGEIAIKGLFLITFKKLMHLFFKILLYNSLCYTTPSLKCLIETSKSLFGFLGLFLGSKIDIWHQWVIRSLSKLSWPDTLLSGGGELRRGTISYGT